LETEHVDIVDKTWECCDICEVSGLTLVVSPPNFMFALALTTRSAVATRSAVIATRSASVAARGGTATMADKAALWGDPTTLCTLEELHAARAVLATYDDVLRTPLLPSWPVGEARISLKLESMQTTGSFKIRGMRYKLHVSDVARLQGAGVVTLSAGNAGKAVAYLGQACGYNAKVYMPETAPDERKRMMEAMGATVVKVPGETLTLTLPYSYSYPWP
jgi:hypothetical protein